MMHEGGQLQGRMNQNSSVRGYTHSKYELLSGYHNPHSMKINPGVNEMRRGCSRGPEY